MSLERTKADSLSVDKDMVNTRQFFKEDLPKDHPYDRQGLRLIATCYL